MEQAFLFALRSQYKPRTASLSLLWVVVPDLHSRRPQMSIWGSEAICICWSAHTHISIRSCPYTHLLMSRYSCTHVHILRCRYAHITICTHTHEHLLIRLDTHMSMSVHKYELTDTAAPWEHPFAYRGGSTIQVLGWALQDFFGLFFFRVVAQSCLRWYIECRQE